MRYEMMFPYQIRRAIDEFWPVVLAAGVLEYHGEHLSVGVDTLLPVKAIELVEKEMDIVVLPAFYYGAASYAVEPPENNGTIQINSEVLCPFANQLFMSLLRVGFRNIHCFIHHQVGDFKTGMPTDLAFRLAAKQAIFEFLEKDKGQGWWGAPQTLLSRLGTPGKGIKDDNKEYNDINEPFDWIKVHPFMDEQTQRKFPGDHAGKLETSLMMAFCPEAVEAKRVSDKKWYTESASEANMEYGNSAKKMILERIKRILSAK